MHVNSRSSRSRWWPRCRRFTHLTHRSKAFNDPALHDWKAGQLFLFSVVSYFLRPPDLGRRGLYILPLNFFLQRTVIAARRRSGAPSKVYQWLDPRCRHKMTLKHFANRSPNFYRGQKVPNLASILKSSRIWRALASKRSNISEI